MTNQLLSLKHVVGINQTDQLIFSAPVAKFRTGVRAIQLVGRASELNHSNNNRRI